MSKEALAKVVQRAISDAAFRRQLNSDPTGALRGFDLSADEASALRTGDAGRLSSLGVDQRMSKSFALGGLASTRTAGTDLTVGGPALVDDLSGAGSRTVIPADPTRPGGSDDIDGAMAGTSTVRTGDDWKFAGRVAPEGTSTVRTGDDWKFAEKNAGGNMANYPAHDGLAGPSGVGYDAAAAATADADATWSGDDIAGASSVADDVSGTDNPHVATDDGQLTP